jgi:adenylate kinase family enzyme
MSYLIYGPPGCGKTTIGQLISNNSTLKYISVGEITRREIYSQSEVGKKLKYYLDLPLEYPIELISNLIQVNLDNLIENKTDFILDGYPKYYWEAENFINYLKQKNIKLRG